MKLLNFLGNNGLKKARQLARKALDEYEKSVLESINRPQLASSLEKTLPSYMPAWNAFQYCGILDLDIAILIHQLMVAETDWRRKLNARILAMTLFEGVDDITGILAKEFQASIGSLSSGDKHREELKLIRKELIEFGLKHQKLLKEIRIITIAHRDKNADLQLVVINGTQVLRIYELAMEFSRLLREFNGLMAKVFEELLLKVKERAGK